ncbi:O-antigen biosynthesis protein [Legionella beliardensis]|uniref:O-antigen biosynthesis protein n=1 Tax=Legionella beliardensis TaxID=91822 RepID=A0A378I1T7_9GAMM|nr:O-antigen ligase family protein [Legionella beliardensis]STX28680.1 O-antigen biosynthesis protein [Legionella beliardensis]
MAMLEITWPKFIVKDAATVLLAALLLAIPISSSGKSIFASLSLVVILLSREHRTQIKEILSRSWCKAILSLVVFALIACLWTPANMQIMVFVLEKYSKLLYLPIFLVGFRNERARYLGVHAFLIAMFITACLSIGKEFNLLTTSHAYADHVFRNHIMTSMMMAFAAYLASFLFFKHKGYMRFVYGSLVALYSYQVLFINTARIGYIIYIALLITLLAQVLNKRQALLGLLSVAFFCSICYQLTPTVQERMTSLYSNVLHYQQDKNTSVGFRLQFHSYAKELFKRHPLMGGGTGSFIYYFEKEDPVPAWGARYNGYKLGHKLLEPHSQYWLTAAELGLIGLIIFAVLFLNLFKEVMQLRVWRFPAIALLILIAIGNFSDSLLFYSGSGYFFIVFMALFLSERQR